MSGYSQGRDTAQILHYLEVIMATQQELQQAIADLKAAQTESFAAIQAALDAEQVEFNDALASMQQAIADLEAQIASGTVTSEQWQAFVDDVNAAKDQVAAARDTLVQDIQGSIVPPAPPVIEG